MHWGELVVGALSCSKGMAKVRPGAKNESVGSATRRTRPVLCVATEQKPASPHLGGAPGWRYAEHGCAGQSLSVRLGGDWIASQAIGVEGATPNRSSTTALTLTCLRPDGRPAVLHLRRQGTLRLGGHPHRIRANRPRLRREYIAMSLSLRRRCPAYE